VEGNMSVEGGRGVCVYQKEGIQYAIRRGGWA